MLADTYKGMHGRIAQARGAAREHACVECGQHADEWALKPGTPDLLQEVVGGCLLHYSLDMDAYQPMCWSCHRRMDRPVLCGRGLHVYRETMTSCGRYRTCGECRRASNAAAYQRRKRQAQRSEAA